MIGQCRGKISSLFPQTVFCSSLEEAQTNIEPYTLLVTNSVLHHLPDIFVTMRSLLPLLDSNAIWLAGHEPSARFYKNIECVKNFEAYLQGRRWSPNYYSQLFKYLIGIKTTPYAKTAREAVRIGLFKRQPPARVIDRLVDFHVAHSIAEMSAGRGFEFSTMEQYLQTSWKLAWVKTYSFMGPIYEGELPDQWRHSCKELARRFPNDGANFCMIWQRI
jgi:hypothetical protein